MNVWVALCSFGKSSLGPKASTHLNLETNSTVLEAPWEPGGDLVSSVSRRPAPKLDLVTLSFWDRWDVGFYSDHSSSKLTHHKMPLQIYLLKSSWNIISPLHRNQGSAKFEKSEKLDRSRWEDAICALRASDCCSTCDSLPTNNSVLGINNESFTQCDNSDV